MPQILSQGWTGNTTTWYFSFEYENTIKGLECTTNWRLYVRTAHNVASTKFVYASYALYINGYEQSRHNWYFEAKKNQFLASGSFTTTLNSNTGKGKFDIWLDGSFYSAANSNDINTSVAIQGGWGILENCDLDSQKTRDNGNNTAQIVFTLPPNNLSNIVQGAKLLWTNNGLIPNESTAYTATKIYQGEQLSTIEDIIPFGAGCQSIQFQLIPIGSKDDITASPPLAGSISVQYYGAPYFNLPIDDELIYKNQKPTIRENLTWIWSAAKQFNSNSPIKGYVLDIYKNNESACDFHPEPHINVWDFVAQDEPLNFQRQDNIQLGIKAYTINGQGNRLYSDTVYTQNYTFGNNGISRFKIDGKWKIGQIWLKDNNKWKIAAALFVKDTDNKWHIAI